jgi:nicotinamidase-related amidase
LRLERDRSALVVVDVQERLFPHIDEHAPLERELTRLVSGVRALSLPIVVTEQYVKGLGPTVPTVREALGEAYAPLEKMTFSCCGDRGFLAALDQTGSQHVLLCGIETHVCVYQTAMDLVARGYYVHVVTDAVGSRRAHNRTLAVHRMEHAGAVLTSVEMALFELLGTAGTDEFRAVSRLVK